MPDENGREAFREDASHALGEAERQVSESESGWELAGLIAVLIVTLAMIAAANVYAP